MKILLIEDCDTKKIKIIETIDSILSKTEYNLTEASCYRDANKNILSNYYDLIIFDIFLPLSQKTTEEENIAGDIVEDFKSSKNYQSESIAISRYAFDELEDMTLFNEAGITVIEYSDDSDSWKTLLIHKLKKLKSNIKYDFLIFCALAKEREAYTRTDIKLGERKIINGLDCQEMMIDDTRGLCLTPKRMGLVEMAILSSKAIEKFNPKIVAMSGICAGVRGESGLLDIIVGQFCWEYQAGKLKDGLFSQDPYQVPLNHHLEAELNNFKDDSNLLSELKKDLYNSKLETSEIKIAPIASGSTVIADADRMSEIGEQQRKMAGLEMEMYSLYAAAQQSLGQPLYFGAKTVVDIGDNTKDDNYHETGVILSARFVVKFLQKYLKKDN